ncbi:hypothetical protein CPB83DRAFT_895367 [Crepidotus variabilis]|uniref:F-box domain-containing protein n=1 Tax=Crepidotus variabilis TaxID=179855 RepID=A0A9P6EEC5_9AGAR|nr:hypothetical protein CPB83DRAFT_895367 [Crepidotus variabilis]
MYIDAAETLPDTIKKPYLGGTTCKEPDDNSGLDMQRLAKSVKLNDVAMSAHLPKEILWLIFQRAIPPKYLLDSFLCAGQDSPWALTLELKKNLTLICRSWYDVATSILYEDVTIRRLPQIKCLLRTLESSSGKGLGKLVKSLELKCFIPQGSVAINFRQTLQVLFAHCIALNHFSYFSPCPPPSAVFQIDNPLPNTITELHLDILVDFETIRWVVGHLQKGLRYLRLGVPLDILPSPVDQPTFRFPYLHTLWLETMNHQWGPELRQISAWTFPALQQLIISNSKLTANTYTQRPLIYITGSHLEGGPILSCLTKLGRNLKYLSLKHTPSDEGFFQKLLACCPLVERVSFNMPYVNYNATCRLGPHPKLQSVDFLLENRDLDVYFTTANTPSFLGERKFFGLPSFTAQWLHQFGATASDIDDSFEIDLFHHRLNKNGRNFSWDVATNIARLKDIQSNFDRSVVSSQSDTAEVASEDWDNVLSLLNCTPYDSENSDDEDLTWASDLSTPGDIDMSDGSVENLLDGDRGGREVDAECDLLGGLLHGKEMEAEKV